MRPQAKRLASSVPSAPFLKRMSATVQSSTSTGTISFDPGRGLTSVAPFEAAAKFAALLRGRERTKVSVAPATRVDVADQEERQVERVRADVAERPRARFLGAEAPAPRRPLRHRPVLQIEGAEAEDLADRALRDQPLGLEHRGAAAVVEADHVDALGPARLLGHQARLVRRERKRLLAEHVLAVLHGELGDRAVGIVGRDDVDDVDVGPLDHLFPADRPLVIAELMGAPTR